MPKHVVAGGGGVPLHVYETGNRAGRPILFVHGFSQSHLAWTRQLRSDLAGTFRLVAMDIRGHGLSSKPPGAYGDSRLWADDVHAVITTLGLDAPILCGWSYGGAIVSDYLATYGEDRIGGTQWVAAVSRLGAPLVEPGFLGADFIAQIPGFFSERVPESVDALVQFLRACVNRELAVDELYQFLGINAAVPPYVREGLLARTLDNDPAIARLRKPALFVHGEADRIVSPRMSTHFATLLPDAEVSTYPDTGHMPFWECPERFNRELRRFAARVWPEPEPVLPGGSPVRPDPR